MRPTSKQLTYIRRLALNRGISFTPPTTKAEASQLIAQLKRVWLSWREVRLRGG